MQLPRYPKKPISRLTSLRNASVFGAVVWMLFFVWRFTSETTPWLAVFSLGLTALYCGDAVLRELEIRRRRRVYPVAENDVGTPD